LWEALGDDLTEVRVDGGRSWLLPEDEGDLQSPPQSRGVRLLPPRDPYPAAPRPLSRDHGRRRAQASLSPRRRPGAVLQDGRLAGLWRVRARGRRAELEVEALERVDREELEAEAARVAVLRGAEEAEVRWT
jgi:hypothetical protein